jgi:hypothetical protein
MQRMGAPAELSSPEVAQALIPIAARRAIRS